MRRKFIAGNWKLNLGPTASVELATALRASLDRYRDVDLAVFPTALSVGAVVPVLAGSGIEVGIQDGYHAASGAFTGTNSPVIAREMGCTRALVGHSERRQFFGDTDEAVAQKLLFTLDSGVLPILCIGETLAEREADQVAAVIGRQLETAMAKLPADRAATVTLAYEPVWAIGTGRTATPEQAQAVHAFIRGWLRDTFPAFVADEVRIQYGGSVNAKNAAALLGSADIDGALVGGASLKAPDFAAIVEAAAAC
jgi:triosephosphate isomerase